MTDNVVCRLCGAEDAVFFHVDRRREYYRCPVCNLIFVPDVFWLTDIEEKAEYDLHRNCEEDAGYRKFLSRLSTPLLERLKPGDRGLDFGCGPGPLLARMFMERGHAVALFDPLYHNDAKLLVKQYDFICATEVVEHFKEPGREFRLLFAMLKPGGWLGVMTKRVLNHQLFSNWHYIRDSTHISFFSEETFAFLARKHKAKLSIEGSDVVLFNKR